MSESNLILKNISKSYYQANNSLSILKDISLEIKSGDFIAVTGPSGSGKTTLLNLVGLLDTSDEGTISFNGYSKVEASQRAENIMKLFMIDDRSLHFPNSLSGGEQQRVAISRALVNNPKFIIADEPTGNLDSKNSDLVFNYLKNYVESESMTLIIATHDEELASKANKRINL